MAVIGLSPLYNADSVIAAVVGGLLLGCSVVFKTSVLSGVLGISNYTKRLMFDAEAKRYLFITGMVVASGAMHELYGGDEPLPPKRVDPLLQTTRRVRLFVGPLLVGIGASMQHGCTSGHGLTGLARLSCRSIVAVTLFMLTGFIVGSALDSSKVFQPDAKSELRVPVWWVGVIVAVCNAFLLLFVAIVCRVVARIQDPNLNNVMLHIGEFVVGGTFGSGLVISGMVRPSRVVAFLDVTSGFWDPTLAFVMGGALLVTLPFFQVLERTSRLEKATLHPSGFDIPPVHGKRPDLALILGAVIFGTGWAMAGLCPGPICCNVASNPSLEILAAIAGLFGGIALWELLQRWRRPAEERKL